MSERWRERLASGAFAAIGLAVLVGFWWLVTLVRPELPSPANVAGELGRLLSAPFSTGGPNGTGIALRLGASLRKVFTGFAFAAAAGIPIGFALGGSKLVWRTLNPIVQLLRPVSPLAWFPLALVLFKDATSAGAFTIGITALWPTVINTAMGVATVPRDHRNVARVFKFWRWRYIRHVLLPHSMVPILTGLRLSMGIAWMVIVATEMLSGADGIGFFVWDSYNNGNLAAVVAAIGFIGVIGFALDATFNRLTARFDYLGGTA